MKLSISEVEYRGIKFIIDPPLEFERGENGVTDSVNSFGNIGVRFVIDYLLTSEINSHIFFRLEEIWNVYVLQTSTTVCLDPKSASITKKNIIKRIKRIEK